MKIIVRYLGIRVAELELDHTLGKEQDKKYFLGRDPQNDLRLTQDFISRKHGHIYWKNQSWWYQDLRKESPHFKSEPKEISHDSAIHLENDVDLITEEYLSSEKTGLYDFVDLKSMMAESRQNRKKIALAAKIAIATAAASVLLGLYLHSSRPLKPQELMEFVKTKVVQFEQLRDETAIAQIKKYAGLKDKDFKDSSGFCSGFIVAQDVVLTAKHCVRGNSDFDMKTNFQLKTHDGKIHPVRQILGFDTKRDFLFLEVPGLQEYGFLEFDSSYGIGQKVYTIGNVEGQGVAIRDGITASRTKDPDDPSIEYLRYSAAASPGNSGGPLVDGWGQVVGLVFARSYSENYNLATGAEYLEAGLAKFVKDRSIKTINLNSKEMFNYNGTAIMSMIGLPVHFSWREHPELALPLNDISIDIKVPAPIHTVAQDLLKETNRSFTEKYHRISKEMKKKDLAEGRWKMQASVETPLIIPSRMEFADVRLVRAGKSLVAPAALQVLSPTSYSAYKEFKRQLLKEHSYKYYSGTQLVYDINDEKDKYSLERLYSSIPKERKTNLGYLFYEPVMHAELILRKDLDMQSSRFPAAEKLKQAFLGKEGLLTEYIVNPFLRPKSFNPFTLKTFDEIPKSSEVKDGLGRTWKLNSWTLFGWVTFDQYCLPLPQGNVCSMITLQTDNSDLLELIRKNHAEFELSQFVIEPIFWEIEALRDYQQSGFAQNLQGLGDIEFKDTRSGGLLITLKKVGVTFEYSRNKIPKMLRFAPGLYMHEGQVEWMTVALQGYDKDSKRRICGIEVEIDGSYSSFAHTHARDSRRLASALPRNLKSRNKKQNQIYFAKDFYSSNLGLKTQLIGQCGNLESSDYRKGEYFVGYGNLSPHKFKSKKP